MKPSPPPAAARPVTTGLAAFWGRLASRRREMVWALMTVGGALIALTTFVESHAHFAWETWPGVFAALGFSGATAVASCARAVGRALTGNERFDA